MKNLLKNWKTTATAVMLIAIVVCKSMGLVLPYEEIIATLGALGFTLSKDYNTNDNNPS